MPARSVERKGPRCNVTTKLILTWSISAKEFSTCCINCEGIQIWQKSYEIKIIANNKSASLENVIRHTLCIASSIPLPLNGKMTQNNKIKSLFHINNLQIDLNKYHESHLTSNILSPTKMVGLPCMYEFMILVVLHVAIQG